MPETAKVSVVIPALDAGSMLLECVASVASEDGRTEIVIFDNGSSDGMPATAAERFPSTTVVRSEENLGFASACNRGAAAATGDYLLFLNSDAVLPRGALEALVRIAIADTTAALWQPVVVSPEGSVENAGEYFSWTGFFSRRNSVPSPGTLPYAAFACCGACLLARRGVFFDVGGFRDDYFAYIEDVDLGWRARLYGWEARVIPTVTVRHVQNVTTRKVLSSSDVRFLTFRNRLRTLIANASLVTAARVLPVFAVASLCVAAVLAGSGRFRSAWAVIRALLWPMSHPVEMYEQRTRSQRLRRRPDRELLRRDLVSRFSPIAAVGMLKEHKRRWEG